MDEKIAIAPIESEFDIFRHPGINHHPEVVSGVLEEDCKSLLQDFFRKRR